MKEYNIYRTTGGNLTFRGSGEPTFIVSSTTMKGAEDCLQMLKNMEKREKKEEQDGSI